MTSSVEVFDRAEGHQTCPEASGLTLLYFYQSWDNVKLLLEPDRPWGPLEEELKALTRVLNSRNITSKLCCRAGGRFFGSSVALAQSGVGGSQKFPHFSPAEPNWGGSGRVMPLRRLFGLQKQLALKPCCLSQSCCSSFLCGSSSQSWCRVDGNFPVDSDGALYQHLIN